MAPIFFTVLELFTIAIPVLANVVATHPSVFVIERSVAYQLAQLEAHQVNTIPALFTTELVPISIFIIVAEFTV